ncbi:MAG: hypothetical protein Ct9H300mP28_05930 [Pseudomonadota bacterium]|nr:MAG: hypothetical protein Ct9H300mP28_05930 [Pseudomonadota bacterium]
MSNADSTNDSGLSIINFGMGSANAATIMDLLTACNPKGVLFLGKCGGLKQTAEMGPVYTPQSLQKGVKVQAMITYLRKSPALPSLKLHKFVSDTLLEYGQEYRTGVIYTTNRRVWEWDKKFSETSCLNLSAIGIDMETATFSLWGTPTKFHAVLSCLFLTSHCYPMV